MGIPLENYVRITSGVGGGTPVAVRELALRCFTTSAEIPTDTVVEFGSAAEVATYFGANSDEAGVANRYFGFISKAVTRPRMISFARWANVDTGATVLGGGHAATVALFNAVTAGGFTINLAGTDGVVTSLDLSSASSFNDVASTTQAAIRAAGGTFAQVDVTYNAVRERFEFDSGNTGNETITLTDGTQTPLALLGFVGSSTARTSNGSDAQTPVEILGETTETTNNFGSFRFLVDLTQEQYVENATWNQAQNLRFIQIVPVTEANASTMSAALIGIDGNSLELTTNNNSNQEQLPAEILAATDYTALNSTVNYMFHERPASEVVVNTGANASLYDGLRVNYVGQTQTAGQNRSFYQRGVLTGTGSSAPIDTNKYANEMWLKSAAEAAFLGALLALTKIPRNANGRATGINLLQGVVNSAVNNGTISVGGTLNATDRAFIQSQTGDALAYLQVENIGYWFDVDFRTDIEDGTETEVLVYTLIYNDDDVVRRVDGRHILI